MNAAAPSAIAAPAENAVVDPDNLTAVDYADHASFTYRGPIIDIHAHVGLAGPEGQPRTADDARRMLDVGRQFGVELTLTMCDIDHVAELSSQFGPTLRFNGSIFQRPQETLDDALARLDRWLSMGTAVLKFWAAPSGRPRGLQLDSPLRLEAARRAQQAGVRAIMVHVADPTAWFSRTDKYADAAAFGTKEDQYTPLRRLLETFPDMSWIAAHMGGSPEEPDRLADLLTRYPHLHVDTSATKWQVRECSAQQAALRALICERPGQFLFGTDLVVKPGLSTTHYASRYWCQRMLWESAWSGRSPIADPDTPPEADGNRPASPMLRGFALPAHVLEQLHYGNAARLLGIAPQVQPTTAQPTQSSLPTLSSLTPDIPPGGPHPLAAT